MTNLKHLFKEGQKVKVFVDTKFHKRIVTETYSDHIIIDVEGISNHCWYEQGFNLEDVYPEYNF